MKRALFITYNNIFQNNSGGTQCSLRNFKLLSKSFDTDYYQVESPKPAKLISLFFLYFPPFTYVNKRKIDQLIATNSYDLIFFDSSTFGVMQRYVKRKYNIKTISFFHNVEYDFISVRFGEKLIKYPYLFLTWYNEKLTLRYSTLTIVLSHRDENRIVEIYRKKPDFIIPITFEDALNRAESINVLEEDLLKSPYCLFVGSMARANYEGIKWFILHVAEHIKGANIVVIGKDFEQKKDELSRTNVKVIGTVDNLSEYYNQAACVISPLFYGAGMKIKIAEALMYGLTIFGTKESFEGYDTSDKTATVICESAKDFTEEINQFLAAGNCSRYNKKSRQLFEQFYSSITAETSFSNILKSSLLSEQQTGNI